MIAAREAPLISLKRLVAFDDAALAKTSPTGESLLHLACSVRSCPEMIQWLLERGLEVDTRDSEQRTPLHVTVQHAVGDTSMRYAPWMPIGPIDVVNVLLSAGADPNAKDSQGNTPLSIAAEAKLNAIREALRAASWK